MVSWFQNLFDARRKIAAWRIEYNEERPHSLGSAGSRKEPGGQLGFRALGCSCTRALGVEVDSPELVKEISSVSVTVEPARRAATNPAD
jgi:hypothetical protein